MNTEFNQDQSNHGGARKGAGRKPGSATKRTREIADKAAEEGLTPLEVMLRAMREFIECAEQLKGDDAQARKLAALKEAAAIAKDASPYIHPRLAAVELTGADGGPVQINDTERIVRINAILAAAKSRKASDVSDLV